MTALVASLRRGLLAYGGLPALVRAVPPLSLVAALWYLSSREGSDRGSGPFGSLVHNAAHVVVYGLLGVLVFLALPSRSLSVAARVRWSVGLAWTYGVIDEVHQSYVPGRDASWADVLSDAFGALLATALLVALLHGSRRGRIAAPWLGVAAVASVCAATWL